MRLKRIKLAGFKSFVDPTSISLPSNLIGVVGPNGCGKSNIIDAVRWVMGESSAKNLRGDSMADVIFSGSTSRKPVGKAFVELIFDNTDGTAPGPYAPFAEIAIRREVSRDGLSEYQINRGKCRRKDITDLFLGTGLGPRTYSVIEQGMVTRIVEGRPEDMRSFIEEAAGISRYKDRRRETETRMRHTRENLERVEDIRKELDSQLQRLKRQSRAATRYKELRSEQRLVHAQLHALRWQALAAQVSEEDATLRRLETDLEARRAEQREIESAIEQLRQSRAESTDRFNEVQAAFYSLGAEIAGVEQAIDHARETRRQRAEELQRLGHNMADAQRELQQDRTRLAELEQRIEESGPRLEQACAVVDTATAELSEAEGGLQAWQERWEAANRAASQPAQEREVQQARIRSLGQNIERLEQRRERLSTERERIEAELSAVDLDAHRREASEKDRAWEELTGELSGLDERIRDTRQRIEELNEELEPLAAEQASAAARLASLEELQAAALGETGNRLADWLAASGLQSAPRLTARLSVEPGWERAAEAVLGPLVGAVCVERLDSLTADGADLSGLGGGVFIEDGDGRAAAASDSLLARVRAGSSDLSSVLDGVYAADDLAEALARRRQLTAREVVVTREGIVVGRTWMSLGPGDGEAQGMLERAGEIDRLAGRAGELGVGVAGLRAELRGAQELIDSLEEDRGELRRRLDSVSQERALLNNRLSGQEARSGQLASRLEQLRAELAEVGEQRARDEAELEAARERVAAAERESGTHEQTRGSLQAERQRILERVQRARAAADQARDESHQAELIKQGLVNSRDAAERSIERIKLQLAGFDHRGQELAAALGEGDDPETELKQRLEALLGKRVETERRLGEARTALADLEAGVREREQSRGKQEQRVQELRELLEQGRMARRELVVRQETLGEQVSEEGFDLDAVRAELPEEANEDTWHERLESLDRKIERIGPVNLVAIEEYEEHAERKGYLDRQYEDLSGALATLENAIRKIDRETRTRFRETFDKVNTGFQTYFPRLFGGGHAYLELTADDLLDAGVTVMARPPGKRNSTIHLLSGGEKALTAVSLLFAFFELNPAPFCLLDEVDAPLDDANVERFADTVRTLAQRSQMIFITHNKISMEAADVLLGVTMAEPGVSRLVAVDVVQAVELAAQAQ
jgi:chromosome segregation protein